MRASFVLVAADISVVYTIEKGVAVVNTASDYCVGHRYGDVPVKMFANAPKLAHVVVATLNDRVNVRDKVEIKNYTQISGGWCERDLATKDIYGKGGCKVFAMTLVASE